MEEKLPANIDQELRLPPATITGYAQEAARQLLTVVEKGGMVITVNKQKYLRYEGWQTLGAFMGRAYGGPVTVGADDAEPVENGYKARARAWCEGKVISEAVAYCYRDEKQWANKPAFQLASMAQTRASSKALRNVLGWVLTLAGTGIKPTPAEEMEEEENPPPKTKAKAKDNGPPSDVFTDILTKIEDAAKPADLKAIPALIGASGLSDEDKAQLKQYYTDKQALLKKVNP